MKNFALCFLNMSRGEVTLEDVFYVKGDSVKQVIENEMEDFTADEDDYVFANGFTVGDENIVLVVDEDSEWFEQLKSYDSWTDATYDAFCEFAYDEQATYA